LKKGWDLCIEGNEKRRNEKKEGKTSTNRLAAEGTRAFIENALNKKAARQVTQKTGWRRRLFTTNELEEAG